jgi:hypothetical protein
LPSKIGLLNKSADQIDPSTEAKQDDIISALVSYNYIKNEESTYDFTGRQGMAQ